VYTVSGNVAVASATTVKSYSLTLNPATGTTIKVSRTSSQLKGAANKSWSATEQATYSNEIYHSDVLKIEFESNPEYEIENQLVNGASFVSGNTHTVTGNVEVGTTAGLTGLVHIYNGTEFVKHLVFIYNGSTWNQYIPYIYNGTDWDICS
jgi:hypothetical protein